MKCAPIHYFFLCVSMCLNVIVPSLSHICVSETVHSSLERTSARLACIRLQAAFHSRAAQVIAALVHSHVFGEGVCLANISALSIE